MSFHAFHWPDHVIGKRESRRIREEHNALFNSHAELLEAAEKVLAHVEDESAPRVNGQCTLCYSYRNILRSAIAKTKDQP